MGITSRRKKRMQETPELDVTTFLNLMVVLIPFLLISAVFSRVAIMELSIPTGAGVAASNKPVVNIEVIVRDQGLEIGNGRSVEARIVKKDGKYDLEMLQKILMRLKAQYPDKEDATVLMEPDIEYDYLIQVMDHVRGARIPLEESEGAQVESAEDAQVDGEGEVQSESREKFRNVVLFPNISIGDAP